MDSMNILTGCVASGLLISCAASAAVNEYGGYDIAGNAGIVERPYAEVRGWNVFVGFDGSRPAYCAAETGIGNDRWRLGFDGGQWQMAIPYAPSGPISDWSSDWTLDGDTRPISGVAVDGWTIAWLGAPERDRIAQGDYMVVNIGRASVDRQLHGTAAVVTKIEECQQRTGVAYTYPEMTQSSSSAAPVSDCPDDSPRLPGSGICQSRAVNYMSRYPEAPPAATFQGQNCQWVLRESALPSMPEERSYLLYFAAQCGSKTAELDYGANNHYAELTTISSAYDIPPRVVAEFYQSHGEGARNILQRAKERANNPAEMAGCSVMIESTDPLKYLVDNVSPAQSHAMAGNGPRAACGPRGLDQDTGNFWTVINDQVWYIMPSHEIYEDIYTPSLTVLTPDGQGGYVAAGF